MSKHVFDRKKWLAMDIFNQMGNIGSEVGRALSAKRRGDEISMLGAYYRGLDLIDTTVGGLVAQKSPRTKEVLRAREEFSNAIMTDKIDDSLEAYFMNYAIVARMQR